MALYATTTSAISWNATPIAGVYSINFNLNRTMIDCTELGDSFKYNLQGQADSSATVEVFFDQASHTALETNLNAAAGDVAVVFTAHTGATYSFSAIVTSIAFSAPVNDVIKATIELKCNSAVTIA